MERTAFWNGEIFFDDSRKSFQGRSCKKSHKRSIIIWTVVCNTGFPAWTEEETPRLALQVCVVLATVLLIARKGRRFCPPFICFHSHTEESME